MKVMDRRIVSHHCFLLYSFVQASLSLMFWRKVAFSLVLRLTRALLNLLEPMAKPQPRVLMALPSAAKSITKLVLVLLNGVQCSRLVLTNPHSWPSMKMPMDWLGMLSFARRMVWYLLLSPRFWLMVLMTLRSVPMLPNVFLLHATRL